MMLRLLGVASLAEAAYTAASTQTCDTFVDQTEATHSIFQTSAAHGLATGSLVMYEAGAGGYEDAKMPKDTIYKVTAIAAGSGTAKGTFRLQAMKADGIFETDSVKLPAWTAKEGLKMNNGKFRLVAKAACIAKASQALTANQTATNKSITFTQASNAACAVVNERLHVLGAYKGTSITANAIVFTDTLLSEDKEVKCSYASATTFQAAAFTVNTGNAASFLLDATAALPATNPGAMCTGTGHICFIKYKAGALTTLVAQGKTTAFSVCKAIPDTSAKCKTAAATKPFFDAATATCKAGTDVLCKAADPLKPSWNSTKSECEAKAASYGHRVAFPAFVAVILSLIA